MYSWPRPTYGHKCSSTKLWCGNISFVTWREKRKGRGGVLLRGGFHASGDLSPLAWLTLSVTAMSWGFVRSLANCWRWAVVLEAISIGTSMSGS